MSKLKTSFITPENDAYPNQKVVINIIGKRPEDQPYLSISVQHNKNEISCSWINTKDLELFAVNILKSLKSNKLK